MSAMTAKYYEEPPQSIIHLYDEEDGVWSLKEDFATRETTDAEVTGVAEFHQEMLHKDPSKDDMSFIAGPVVIDHPVGDVNSDAKGTGARALGPDKVPMQWVPVRFWLDLFKREAHELTKHMSHPEIGHLLSCVQALSEFQEGKASGQEMMAQLGPVLMEEAAKVFEYGAQKYKAWNWLKGMPWSIPVGCALRHMKAVFIEQELLDGESMLPHVGHFACNIVMLATYDVTYPEGNDMPPAGLW